MAKTISSGMVDLTVIVYTPETGVSIWIDCPLMESAALEFGI